MTAKQFFKSAAFKCIVVLLSVLLISGILLTIADAFLRVSDEERFNRKISVVYGSEQVSAQEEEIGDRNPTLNNATVEKLWYIEEKSDYLVQASSRGNGGNVTCWIALNVTGKGGTVKSIRKVMIYSVADPAEFVGNIGGEVYEKFPDDYFPGKIFEYGTKGGAEYIETGASMTLSAVCRSVNTAIDFINGVVDPYEDFEYKTLINTSKLEMTVNGTDVDYKIVTYSNGHADAFTVNVTVGADKTIKSFTIVTNGSSENEEGGSYADYMSPLFFNDGLKGKTLADITGYLGGGELSTGATLSNTLCFNAAAFALANYDRALTFDGGNA